MSRPTCFKKDAIVKASAHHEPVTTQKCHQIPVAWISFLNGLGQIISLEMLFLVIAIAIFSDVSFAIGLPKLDYDFRGLGSIDDDIQSSHPHKKPLELKY